MSIDTIVASFEGEERNLSLGSLGIPAASPAFWSPRTLENLFLPNPIRKYREPPGDGGSAV
jgi:hypothetical protein